MEASRLSRAEIEDDAARSLEDLRTDHVDIYWLHRDDVRRPVGEIMETLNGLIESGMTRMIGVSNWTTARIEAANVYAAAHGLRPLDANQPQLSLARPAVMADRTLAVMDAAMFRMHRRTGMALMPFSSQAGGFFTKLDAMGEDGLSEAVRRQFLTDENKAIYRRLTEARARTGLSVGALALAWLTCQDFPVIPLCGASRVSQVLALDEAADAVIEPVERDRLRRE